MREENKFLGSPIRVVIFTSGPFLERGVKQFLCQIEDHPEIDLVACIGQAKYSSRWDRYQEILHRRGILAIPIILTEWASSLCRFLYHPSSEIRLFRKLSTLSRKIIFVPNIHSAEVILQVQDLSPDLGLIYGSPILKPELFNIPANGTLGIHHGKVPEYRGKKTVFWAIYNGEKTAGVTIQKINSGLDTGEIVKQGTVVIGQHLPGRIWKELNELGFNLYIQAILEVKQGRAIYTPQIGESAKVYKDPSLMEIIGLWKKIYIRKLCKFSFINQQNQ